MKLKDALKKYVTTTDLIQLRRIVDFLRSNGFNYADVYAFAERSTGIGPIEWETLMYAVDSKQ